MGLPARQGPARHRVPAVQPPVWRQAERVVDEGAARAQRGTEYASMSTLTYEMFRATMGAFEACFGSAPTAPAAMQIVESLGCMRKTNDLTRPHKRRRWMSVRVQPSRAEEMAQALGLSVGAVRIQDQSARGGSARRALPRHASDARRETARATGSYVMKLALSQRFRVLQRTLPVDDRLRFVNRCIQRPVFLTIPFFLDALNGDLHGLLCIKFARDKHETVESEYPQVIAPDALFRKRSNQVLKSVVRVLSVGHVSLHRHVRGLAA